MELTYEINEKPIITIKFDKYIDEIKQIKNTIKNYNKKDEIFLNMANKIFKNEIKKLIKNYQLLILIKSLTISIKTFNKYL